MRLRWRWRTILIWRLRATICRSRIRMCCAHKRAGAFAASIRAWCKALREEESGAMGRARRALALAAQPAERAALEQERRDWCNRRWAWELRYRRMIHRLA